MSRIFLAFAQIYLKIHSRVYHLLFNSHKLNWVHGYIGIVETKEWREK
jgi:hypothetical protein